MGITDELETGTGTNFIDKNVLLLRWKSKLLTKWHANITNAFGNSMAVLGDICLSIGIGTLEVRELFQVERGA